MVASSLLAIEPEHTSQGLILHVNGELFLETSAALREALKTELSSGSNQCVIADIRKIPIMDSSGIAALLMARKAAIERSVRFHVLVELGSQPHRVLAVATLLGPLNVIFDMDLLEDCE